MYRFFSNSFKFRATEFGEERRNMYNILRLYVRLLMQDIDQNNVSLSKFKGKVLLIVNVASKWYPRLNNDLQFCLLVFEPKFKLFLFKSQWFDGWKLLRTVPHI